MTRRDAQPPGPAGLVLAGLLAILAYRYRYVYLGGQYLSLLLVGGLALAILEPCARAILPGHFPDSTGARARGLIRLLLAAAALALAGLAGAELLLGVLAKAKTMAATYLNPLPVNVMEGGQALRAMLMPDVRLIYTDMRDYPFLVTVYTPLYPLLTALAAPLADTHLAAGRLVSIIASLVVSTCAGLIVRRLSGSALAGLAAGLYLLYFRYGFEYGYLCRVDFTAWAFFFAAMATALAAAGRDRPGALAWPAAAVLTVAAFYAKQQTLAASAVLFATLFLLYPKCRRPLAFRFAPTALILAALAALVLWGLTDGAFWLNAVTFPKAMSADPEHNTTRAMVSRLTDFGRENAAFLCLYALHLAASAARRRPLPTDCVNLAAFPLTVLALRWHGGDANYFVSFFVLAACSLSVSLRDLWTAGRAGPGLALVGLSFLIPLPDLHPETWTDFPSRADFGRPPELALLDQEAGTRAMVLMDSEAAALAPRPGRYLFDAIECANFERYGLWRFSESKLARDIAARAFPLIINGSDFIPERMKRLIEANYAAGAVSGKIAAYVPRRDDAVLSLADPAAPPPGLTVVRLEGLARPPGEDCLAPPSPEGAGELVIRLTAKRPVRKLTVVAWPRVNQDDPRSAATLAYSPDGRDFHELAGLRGTGKGGWTPVLGQRFEAAVAPDGPTAFLRLELAGKAQFWIGPDAPMLFYLTY